MEKNKWVFLRGLARGNIHWAEFPETLKATTGIIEIELLEIPGNGDSYNEKTPICGKRVVEILRSRSRFVRENTHFHLCGVSLGGMVALKWAELFPNEVSSVVIINSSLRRCSSVFQRLVPSNYPVLAQNIFSNNYYKNELRILRCTSNFHHRYSDKISIFAKFAKEHPIMFSNFIKQLWLAQNIDVQSNFSCPIKIVMSLKDRFVSPECSKAMAQYLKAPLFIHPTAGHDLPLDDPNWLCNILLNKH